MNEMDLFLRAVLMDVSPGEALLLDDKSLETTRSFGPGGGTSKNTFKFGLGEAGAWVAPVLVLFGKWLLETAQEPLRVAIGKYISDAITPGDTSPPPRPPAKFDVVALDKLSQKFGDICRKEGINATEVDRLTNVFLISLVKNAKLLSAVVR